MNRLKQVIKSKAYTKRFILSYAILLIILVDLIYLLLTFSPAGLRIEEINQISNLANLNLFNLLDFPFLLVQKAIITVFGLNILTAKLASIIFGSSAMALLYYSFIDITKRKNALASLIVFAFASNFLIILQDATPIAYLLFCYSLIIFIATKVKQKIDQKQDFTKSLLMLSFLSGLACYSPIFIYFLLTSIVVIFIHPKLRLTYHKIELKTKIISLIVFLSTIIPLIANIIFDSSLGQTLLAFNQGSFTLKDNLLQIIDLTSSNPIFISQPVFNLGLLFLMALGLFAIVRNFHTIRSFFIASITISSLIFGLLIIRDLRIIILLAGLLLAFEGVSWLIDYWTKIFPFNPYARFSGSLIIVSTIVIIAFSSAQSLLLSYKYNFSLANKYNNDLTLALSELNPDNQLIVGDKQEQSFYQMAGFKTKIYTDKVEPKEGMMLTSLAFAKSQKLIPKKVIVNDKTADSVRFYIY